MKEISTSLIDTEQIAQKFLETCQPKIENEQKQACIVALSGNLGSGKTTFTQSCAKILGIKETVTSPTFVIEKIYSINSSTTNFPENLKTYTKFIHIDAYRLESAQELATLGWKEIAENPQNLIFIEWPEKVAELLTSYIVKTLYFTFIDEKTREINSS